MEVLINGRVVPECDCKTKLNNPAIGDPHWTVVDIERVLGRPLLLTDRIEVRVAESTST